MSELAERFLDGVVMRAARERIETLQTDLAAALVAMRLGSEEVERLKREKEQLAMELDMADAEIEQLKEQLNADVQG